MTTGEALAGRTFLSCQTLHHAAVCTCRRSPAPPCYGSLSPANGVAEAVITPAIGEEHSTQHSTSRIKSRPRESCSVAETVPITAETHSRLILVFGQVSTAEHIPRHLITRPQTAHANLIADSSPWPPPQTYPCLSDRRILPQNDVLRHRGPSPPSNPASNPSRACRPTARDSA